MKSKKYILCPKCKKPDEVIFGNDGIELWCKRCSYPFTNLYIDVAFERGVKVGRKDKARELQEWLRGE